MRPDAHVEYVVRRSFSDGEGRMKAGSVPTLERMQQWTNFDALVSGEYIVPRGHPLLDGLEIQEPVTEAETIENEIAAIEAMEARRLEKLNAINGA